MKTFGESLLINEVFLGRGVSLCTGGGGASSRLISRHDLDSAGIDDEVFLGQGVSLCTGGGGTSSRLKSRYVLGSTVSNDFNPSNTSALFIEGRTSSWAWGLVSMREGSLFV